MYDTNSLIRRSGATQITRFIRELFMVQLGPTFATESLSDGFVGKPERDLNLGRGGCFSSTPSSTPPVSEFDRVIGWFLRNIGKTSVLSQHITRGLEFCSIQSSQVLYDYVKKIWTRIPDATLTTNSG